MKKENLILKINEIQESLVNLNNEMEKVVSKYQKNFSGRSRSVLGIDKQVELDFDLDKRFDLICLDIIKSILSKNDSLMKAKAGTNVLKDMSKEYFNDDKDKLLYIIVKTESLIEFISNPVELQKFSSDIKKKIKDIEIDIMIFESLKEKKNEFEKICFESLRDVKYININLDTILTPYNKAVNKIGELHNIFSKYNLYGHNGSFKEIETEALCNTLIYNDDVDIFDKKIKSLENLLTNTPRLNESYPISESLGDIKTYLKNNIFSERFFLFHCEEVEEVEEQLALIESNLNVLIDNYIKIK